MWLRHIHHPRDYLSISEKDGVWDSSYVSTGVYDESVNKTLGEAVRAGDDNNQSDLGNGEASYGYAVKGVEFTYLKVADIVQFTESERDGVTYNHVEVLYGIDKTIGADLLNALGLQGGDKRYTNADQLDENKYFYQSDVLIDALAQALQSNSTSVKNALEKYIAANGGTAMPLTDSYGKSEAKDLELGLYLVVETKVPEMVTSTCNPFFVSIPMTSVDGTNATDGGTRWIYDITIYPKNSTGIPTLEKTLRENQDDTGKHNGTSDDITDGYAHTGTASDGDVIDYQIISTLPSITSESTYLSEYTFIDTLSAGLTYNKQDVVIEFFSDAACTNLLNTWNESDGLFTVAYSQTEANESVMTIDPETGLEVGNRCRILFPWVDLHAFRIRHGSPSVVTLLYVLLSRGLNNSWFNGRTHINFLNGVPPQKLIDVLPCFYYSIAHVTGQPQLVHLLWCCTSMVIF